VGSGTSGAVRTALRVGEGRTEKDFERSLRAREKRKSRE